MKSGEDFRQAMGQADDGFVRVIKQALSELRVPRKRGAVRRRRSGMAAQKRVPVVVSRDI